MSASLTLSLFLFEIQIELGFTTLQLETAAGAAMRFFKNSRGLFLLRHLPLELYSIAVQYLSTIPSLL
jgi:hypothetical protein